MKIGNRMLDIHGVTIKDLKDYDLVTPNQRTPFIGRLEQLQKDLKEVECLISNEEHHIHILSDENTLYKEKCLAVLRKQLYTKKREQLVLEIQQLIYGYEYLIIEAKIREIV